MGTKQNECLNIIKELYSDLLIRNTGKSDTELVEEAFKKLEDISYPVTSEFLKLPQYSYIKKRNMRFEVTRDRKYAIHALILNLMCAYDRIYRNIDGE